MRKYVFLIIFLILISPTTIKAKERLEVSCNKTQLKANEETECKIIASDLNFTVTGVSVKLKTTSNIEIISSKYNDKKWKMLDDEFNVKDINLINGNPIKEDTLEIASFKIKSSISKKIKEDIILEDLLIGDQNYEKRKIDVKNETIYINTKNNIDNNYILYISLVLVGAIIIFCIIRYNKKDNRGAV